MRAAQLPVTMDSMTNIGPLPRLWPYTGLGHHAALGALPGMQRTVSETTASQAMAL